MQKQLEASKARVAELEAKVARLEAEMASTKPAAVAAPKRPKGGKQAVKPSAAATKPATAQPAAKRARIGAKAAAAQTGKPAAAKGGAKAAKAQTGEPAAKRAKGGTTAAKGAAKPAAPAGPELILQPADDMEEIGDDKLLWKPMGAPTGATVWAPSIGPDTYWFGHVVIPNDESKCNRYGVAAKAVDCAPVLVARLAPGAAKPAAKGKENASKGRLPPLAKPVRYETIWDSDSGLYDDLPYCCILKPVPPPGYVALGCLAFFRKKAENAPTAREAMGFMTVREDLTVPARFGNKLWCSSEAQDEGGRLTEVAPGADGINLRAFWASDDNDGLDPGEARAFAKSKVKVDNPNPEWMAEDTLDRQNGYDSFERDSYFSSDEERDPDAEDSEAYDGW